MILPFPPEVVQASLLSSLFSFDKFELILGILKKFVKLGQFFFVVEMAFLSKFPEFWQLSLLLSINPIQDGGGGGGGGEKKALLSVFPL